MGIDAHNLALLAHAADLGCRYTRTLGIGRQALFVDPPELERLRGWRGLPPPSAAATEARPAYFEPLMREWFGAQVVDSVDASPYEQATLIHDMNRPWPAPLSDADRYDAVLDFGCLEHVFDFPTAWRNVVDRCAVGGHVFHALPANNLCGHGFYQFSPELFFNLYRAANGFDLRGVWFATKADLSTWWQVADPQVLKRRVNLLNASETYMLVLARKTAEMAGEMPVPQQSDYAEGEWVGKGGDASSPGPGAGPRTGAGEGGRRLPFVDALRTVRDALTAWRNTRRPPAPDYARVDLATLLGRGRGR